MFTRRSLVAALLVLAPTAAKAETLIFHRGRWYAVPDADEAPDDGEWLRDAQEPPWRTRRVPRPEPEAPFPDATDAPASAADPIHADDERIALRSISPIPRSVVRFSGHGPGTLVVSTGEKRLYFVLDDGLRALRYGIGVGREGFAWKGTETISAKRRWPDWTPPAAMRTRDPSLPEHMEGGLANPLGARALYLGDTLYRIHGTNQPKSIGGAVSSGCIRLANADILDLVDRVEIGAPVVVT